MAQMVEHILGKDEVTSSNLVSSSRKKSCSKEQDFFQLNPPLRVGEILLRNVKSSLRSGEIAAAVGGFNFTFCVSKIFHQRRKPLISPCVSTISLTLASSPLLCYNISINLFILIIRKKENLNGKFIR